MSLFPIDINGTNPVIPSASPSFSPLASAVHQALRGSDNPSTTLAGTIIEWAKRAYEWFTGTPADSETAAEEETFLEEAEAFFEPEIFAKSPRTLQTTTEVIEASATKPLLLRLTRNQADDVSGNGTFAVFESVTLNGQPFPNGSSIVGISLRLETIPGSVVGAGAYWATSFDPNSPEGLALVVFSESNNDTFALVDQNLSIVGKGGLYTNPPLGKVSTTKLYFSKNDTAYIGYVSKQGSNINMTLCVLTPDGNGSLSQTLFNASDLLFGSYPRSIGDPSFPYPETAAVGVFGPTRLVSWKTNTTTQRVDLTSPAPILNDGRTLSLAYHNQSWVICSDTTTTSAPGNLSLFRQTDPRGPLSLSKEIIFKWGNLYFTSGGIVVQDAFTPTLCRFDLELNLLKCMSPSKTGTPAGANELEVYSMSSLSGFGLKTVHVFDSQTLEETAQLSFPNLTKPLRPLAAVAKNSNGLLFSAFPNLHRVNSQPEPNQLGIVAKAKIPAFLMHSLPPDVLQIVTFKLSVNGQEYTYTQNFKVTSQLPFLQPNCIESLFSGSLGSNLTWTFSSDCITHPDYRPFKMMPGIGFSAYLLSPNVTSLRSSSQEPLFNASRSIYDLETIPAMPGRSASAYLALSMRKQPASSSDDPQILTLSDTPEFIHFPRTIFPPDNPNPDPRGFLYLYAKEYFLSFYQKSTLNEHFYSFVDYRCSEGENTPLACSVSPLIKIENLGHQNQSDYLSEPNIFVIKKEIFALRSYTSKASPGNDVWRIYNASSALPVPELICASDKGPYFKTPMATDGIQRNQFSKTYSITGSNGLHVTETGVVLRWAMSTDCTNFNYEFIAQLSPPSSWSSPYSFLGDDLLMYANQEGEWQIWDFKDPNAIRLVGQERPQASNFQTTEMSPDGSHVAILDNSQMLWVYEMHRFSDGTFGLSLCQSVQLAFISSNNRLLWQDDLTIWVVPFSVYGPDIQVVSAPNGSWKQQWRIELPIEALSSKKLELRLSDGVQILTVPFSTQGSPLPLKVIRDDLTLDESGTYQTMLADVSGRTDFFPGEAAPSFSVDLNHFFQSLTAQYVSARLKVDLERSMIPVYLTLIDLGNGRYSFVIPGGTIPPHAVNIAANGEALPASGTKIQLYVTDTEGSSGFNLKLSLRVQAHTPYFSGAFSLSGVTGQKVCSSLPKTVTGVNVFGFEANTDDLTPCAGASQTPAWVKVECETVCAEFPPNSVGTQIFALRPRIFLPNSNQTAGNGEWINGTLLNPGQPYQRPLGSLMEDDAPSVKIGVTTIFNITDPDSIFMNPDGNFSSSFKASAKDPRTEITRSQDQLTITVNSPTGSEVVSLQACQAAIYASPECATVSTTLTVLPSLSLTLPEPELIEGTPTDYPLSVSTSERATHLSVSLKFKPTTGSSQATVIEIPDVLKPYLNGKNSIPGSIELLNVPVHLLSILNRSGGVTEYQIPLNLTLAEAKSPYWEITLTGQDFVESKKLNPTFSQGQTTIVQEKPVAPTIYGNAQPCSNNQMLVGSIQQCSMLSIGFGGDSYNMTSSSDAIVVLPRNAPSDPNMRLKAQTPGTAVILACLINKFGLGACTEFQTIEVLSPNQNAGSGDNAQTQGITSSASIGGPLLMLALILGPIVYSHRKQKKEALILIRENTTNSIKILSSLKLNFEKDHQEKNLDEEISFANLFSAKNEDLIKKITLSGYLFPELHKLFQLGGMASISDQFADNKLLRLAIRVSKDEIPSIIETGNTIHSINGLALFFCLSVILSSSRKDVSQVIDYAHRDNLLAWIDDRASVIGKGTTPNDHLAKALLKLSRMCLQPLKTNMPLRKYVFSHIAGVLGTVIRYCRSRKHQGNAQTVALINRFMASLGRKEENSIAQELRNSGDWRLMTLASMMNRPAFTRAPSSPKISRRDSIKQTASRCCARNNKKKLDRVKEIEKVLWDRAEAETKAVPDKKASTPLFSSRSSTRQAFVQGQPRSNIPLTGSPTKFTDNPLLSSREGRAKSMGSGNSGQDK